jgi:AraC-like DNA-binding protein
MSTLEAALRGGAIALLLLLALVGWRDGRQIPAARYGAFFALCGIAYLIEAAPGIANQCPPWVVPIRLLSLSSPAVFCLWSAAHFDDDFTPGWLQFLPWLGMIALGGWAVATDSAIAWHSLQVAALVLVGVGVWRALAGRAGDLVEGRRRFRLVLAVGVGLFIAALNLPAFSLKGNVNLATAAFAPAGLAALVFAAAMLGLGLRAQRDHMPVSPEAAAPRDAGPARPPAGVDADEAALLARLQHLMETDKIYREEGFGIAALADRLVLAEYRLRRLINQRLGQRNFTSFVNGYRLAETAAALADPNQAAVPIMTIALDAGFQSIGPFNRAFKAHTGMTPSEFRRDRLARPEPKAAE